MIKKLKISSSNLKRDVEVNIRVPKKPFTQILFAHDGQSLFTNEGSNLGQAWGLDQILDQLEQTGFAPTLVIAPVSNGGNVCIERMREYSLFENKTYLVGRTTTYGQKIEPIYPNDVLEPLGHKYLAFFQTELLPVVTAKYQINEHMEKYIMGASMGGLMALFTLFDNQEYFTGAMCISSAFWYNQEAIVNYLDQLEIKEKATKLKLYLDVGTAEDEEDLTANDYLDSNRKIVESLKTKAVALQYLEIAGGKHDADAWSLRIGSVLQQMMTKE
ncbi:MAG: alpha/beta hydrolase [Mycoplasmatales bacterium]